MKTKLKIKNKTWILTEYSEDNRGKLNKKNGT